MCDGRGRPVRLHLTAGHVSDFRGADILLANLPGETEEVIGDRGMTGNKIRQFLAERNITACIPSKKNWKSKSPYNWHLYKKRHLIETCSQNSRTGGAWQHDMTAAFILSCSLSTSTQASSSILKNEF
ncbi:transposase [Acetobacter aceti]|uniref:transposase n=1 Tax=Acetobacter aceti TaxID=435 RepID=UPI000C06982A